MILVTGANGFVGRHVVGRLHSAGRDVRAMVRQLGASSAPAGVEVVAADVTDPSTLEAALTGVDSIVHCAAITANLKEPYRGAYDTVNRAGTENLVAKARAAGVSRVVLVSGYGTLPAKEGTYMATRWGMEEAVRKGGIRSAILQPTVQFGDGAEFVRALAALARVAPVVPAIGSSKRLFQPIWIEDVVSCIERLLDDDTLLGRAHPVGGAETLTYRELIRAIAHADGRRRTTITIPMFVARLQARVMSTLLPRPPLTPASLELFGFDNVAGPGSVSGPFGFEPRGFSEHLAAHGLDG